MPSKPTVSVIIVSYNVCDYLTHCLDSLQNLDTEIPFDIWVVDNNSSDSTVSILEKKYSFVNLIKNNKNSGFAAANNIGILQSKGNYVWLLNPDTIVANTALDPLVQFLDSNPEYGACGSKLLNPDGSLQPSTFPFPTVKNETIRLFHLEKVFPKQFYQMQTWDSSIPHNVDINQGASLMLRRETIDQIGLLDEQFFMYTEEVDLCYRLIQANWKNAWIPTSTVIHYGGQSTRQNKTAMFLQLYQTKIQFFRKHYGKEKTDTYKKIIYLASLFRILPLSFKNLLRSNPDNKNLVHNYNQLIHFLPEY
ncbi:MAG: glycosyl transferase [Anaerolineaceae bacterium]|nr:glycosyl transferase [Anaerolineaceae bacterium]